MKYNKAKEKTMAGLLIESPIAERIRSLAEQEQRPIEAVLEAMLERYITPLSIQEINARLRSLHGITVPPDEAGEAPISEVELDEIAHRAGAAGSLSDLIIEERKQGW
jgi:hypothetical protein